MDKNTFDFHQNLVRLSYHPGDWGLTLRPKVYIAIAKKKNPLIKVIQVLSCIKLSQIVSLKRRRHAVTKYCSDDENLTEIFFLLADHSFGVYFIRR